MQEVFLADDWELLMPAAPERLVALEERVANHIKFFWVAVSCGFAWLAVISGLLYSTNNTLGRVEKAQANAPAQIVATLLNQPMESKVDAAARLGAVATVLASAKRGPARPDRSILKVVSVKISEVQQTYPDLPQVWQASSAFIDYKWQVLAPTTAGIRKGESCKTELRAPEGFIFTNCEVALEDLARRIQNVTVYGAPANFTFINCVVSYNGGPIPAKHLRKF